LSRWFILLCMNDKPSVHAIDLSHAFHVCVDMQRLFADNSDWAIPWLSRILPNVQRVIRAFPTRTIFTRFIPPEAPQDSTGAWRTFYDRWPHMTRQRLPSGMLDVVPELLDIAQHAEVMDKSTFSPWHFTDLADRLRRQRCSTVIVTGGETDMCVLATVLGAIDLGFHTVVVTDALCSSVDKTHDAIMQLYHERYSQQISAFTTQSLIEMTSHPR